MSVPEPVLYFCGTVVVATTFLAAKAALARRFPKLAQAMTEALEDRDALMNEHLATLARDPALKAKRAKHGALLLRLTSSSGDVLGEATAAAGDPEASLTTVDLRCASSARVDDALRGRADLWRVWAKRELVLEGDTAACLLVTEALFRLAMSRRSSTR